LDGPQSDDRGGARPASAEGAYLDDELCAINATAQRPLPGFRSRPTLEPPTISPISIFDPFFLNEKDLMAAPLIERKERLRTLLESASPPIQYSHHPVDSQLLVYLERTPGTASLSSMPRYLT
jgi:ATP-dependent DNA ligase